MTRYGFIWVLGCLAAGCRFDPSGIAVRDSAVVDTGSPDTGEIDAAGPCPEPLHLELGIAGVTSAPAVDEPFVRVLVGDVVELSAAGSCTQQGTLSYQWQVSPVDSTRTTAAPDLASERVTLYPILPREYVVSLTIDNGTSSMQRTVLGIAAYGWEQNNGLPGGQDVRDLAVGGDSLWIAHKDGAYRMELGTVPANVFVAVNNEVTSGSIGANLSTVYYRDAVVWFGQGAARSDLWRVDLDQTAVTQVPYVATNALGQAAEVLDIGFAAPGLALATDQGLTTSADGLAFGGRFVPADSTAVHAYAAGNGRHYAGGRRLYDLDLGGMAHDPFQDPGPDSQIRALAVDTDNQELWIGSATSGVARAASTGTFFDVKGLYQRANDRLAVDDIRDLVVETTGPYAGDVWAATSLGVARYVRARDTWLLMGNNQGLNGRTDVRAVAIDNGGGRRVIYAGGKNGVVSLHVPP